jgi:hypothetical protein
MGTAAGCALAGIAGALAASAGEKTDESYFS